VSIVALALHHSATASGRAAPEVVAIPGPFEVVRTARGVLAYGLATLWQIVFVGRICLNLTLRHELPDTFMCTCSHMSVKKRDSTKSKALFNAATDQLNNCCLSHAFVDSNQTQCSAE
jgi:hypothetical protein